MLRCVVTAGRVQLNTLRGSTRKARVARPCVSHNLLHTRVSKTFFKTMIEINSDLINKAPINNSSENKFPRKLAIPKKSPEDKKEYRVLQLENDLTALLIADVKNTENQHNELDSDMESVGDESTSTESMSDTASISSSDSASSSGSNTLSEEQRLAAVGLCVGVGSFSDPPEIPGLAHFLEHMVFMGSEKFPSENDFDKFLKKRGGSSNASTELEYTTFYFDCHERHLPIAMDKFSQFFISPLMKRDAMTREREAIESEFQMAVPNDESRMYQLLCSLAKPGHPVTKFSWGNMITLRDNIDDNILYQAVHKFHKRHYSAHRMHLAVQACLPLDTLEELVVKYFSSIPNNSLPADDFSQYKLSFETNEFYKLYWVKPISDKIEVQLKWAFPPNIKLYRTKPHECVAWVLGHEGRGTLISYLREKMWAFGITCGCDDSGDESNSMFSFFTISVDLTEDGFKNVAEVLNLIFSYIKLLQTEGISQSVFEEIQKAADISFQFAEDISSSDYVETLANDMQLYPPEDYITGSELYFEYDPKAIQFWIDGLLPEKANVMIFAKDSDVNYNQVEPWFKTQYYVQDIPPIWLESWKNQMPHPQFHLPTKNIYLPTDFSLVSHSEPIPLKPTKILHDSIMELWYRPDTKFKKPNIYLFFYLISPLPFMSAENSTMIEIFVNALNMKMKEDLYPASMVHIKAYVFSASKGIEIQISGFSHKVHLLVELVAQHLASCLDNLNEKLFDTLLLDLKKKYFNHFNKPDKLKKDLRLSLLLPWHWTSIEKHAATEEVTFLKVKEFIPQFLKQLRIQALIQGNYTQQQAIDVASLLPKILNISPLPPAHYPKYLVRQVPLGEKYCQVKSFNKSDGNSVVMNYYQSGPVDLYSSVIIDFIMMLMEEPLFNTLRTQEQLGYDVDCNLYDTYGILGFGVTVNFQVNKFDADHVEQRIESFLKQFLNELKNVEEDDLEKVRSALIEGKMSADLYLKQEVDRNWSEITSEDYFFDRLSKEVNCIQTIKSQDLIKWFQKHTASGNKKNFRKLSFQVLGHSAVDEENHENTRVPRSIDYGKPNEHKGKYFLELSTITKNSADLFVKDLKDYKENLYMYPEIHIQS